MGKDVNQKISKVDGAEILQVAGDFNLTVNKSTVDNQLLIEEVNKVCHTLVKNELDTYTKQACLTAQTYIKGYIDSFVDRIDRLEEDVRIKLQQPAVQVSLRRSLLGSLQIEDENIKDENIGIMIDRLETEQNSTQRFVTDKAIQILPLLSRKHLSLLALYCFFDLRLSYTARGLEKILSESLITILKDVAEINALDFSYLDSLGCYSNTVMFLPRKNFLEAFSSSYDTMFSQLIDKNAFISELNQHNVSIDQADSIWHNFFDVSNINRIPWSSVLFDKGLAIGDYGRLESVIKPLIQPLSYTGIEQKLISYNPLWEDALRVFNSQTSRSVYLGPVAKYLGVRFLRRYINIDVDYTIFYKVLQ